MDNCGKDFDVFGLFSKLRACNVSVIASGVFFSRRQVNCLAQKLSGEAPNLCIFEKKNDCWERIWALLVCFVI